MEPDDDEDLGAHLEAVLIGGRERRELVVVAYDDRWPERYGQERLRIVNTLGDELVAIHHVGSTAVPGLAAKPIVDMIVVVRRPDDESTYVPALEHAGYELRVRELDHRMFRTRARDVHVHCWSDATDVDRHLVFRDWLRHDADDRDRYSDLKQQLACQEWPDMNFYARAKSDLVEEILDRATRWDRAGRPDGSPAVGR